MKSINMITNEDVLSEIISNESGLAAKLFAVRVLGYHIQIGSKLVDRLRNEMGVI